MKIENKEYRTIWFDEANQLLKLLIKLNFLISLLLKISIQLKMQLMPSKQWK